MRRPSLRLHSPQPAAGGHHSCSTHWSVEQRGDAQSADNGGLGCIDQAGPQSSQLPTIPSHRSNQNLPPDEHFKITFPFIMVALKKAGFPKRYIKFNEIAASYQTGKVTSFICWEDEATYLKDLEASLHISLFLAKLDSWPLTTLAFDLIHSSLGPRCYRTKLANSVRLPASLYSCVHDSLSAFIAPLSGLLTGP